MLYWNKKHHYRFFSSEERELLIKEMSPLWLPKWFKRINLALNIAAPLFLYFYLRLPLREIAFAFIAFDILLHVFEQFVLITLPWIMSKIPLTLIAQLQYNGITKRIEQIEDQLYTYRKINCEDCDDTINPKRCTSCSTPRELMRQCDSLYNAQTYAKAHLDALISTTRNTVAPKTQITQTEPASTTTQDTTLVGYFQNLSVECNKIISTHRFDFLIAVRKNADSLASILKGKPEGETEVPGILCYRLDNLVKLLNTLSKEPEDVRKAYFENAKNASNELAEEMQQTIMAINKMIPGTDANTPAALLTKITLTKETNHV